MELFVSFKMHFIILHVDLIVNVIIILIKKTTLSTFQLSPISNSTFLMKTITILLNIKLIFNFNNLGNSYKT